MASVICLRANQRAHSNAVFHDLAREAKGPADRSTVLSQAKVFSFGATQIDPRHLAIWITTQTDKERDLMRATPDLVPAFRRALLNVVYPPAAVPEVGFEFESQETVDRDYKGRWFYRIM